MWTWNDSRNVRRDTIVVAVDNGDLPHDQLSKEMCYKRDFPAGGITFAPTCKYDYHSDP